MESLIAALVLIVGIPAWLYVGLWASTFFPKSPPRFEFDPFEGRAPPT